MATTSSPFARYRVHGEQYGTNAHEAARDNREEGGRFQVVDRGERLAGDLIGYERQRRDRERCGNQRNDELRIEATH